MQVLKAVHRNLKYLSCLMQYGLVLILLVFEVLLWANLSCCHVHKNSLQFRDFIINRFHFGFFVLKGLQCSGVSIEFEEVLDVLVDPLESVHIELLFFCVHFLNN